MPRRAHVEPWLSELELLEWVRAGGSRAAYQRCLAVWLTYLRHFPAHEVATLLGVSTPAVWRWLSQYNRQGSAGLARRGRGGRRWAFLPLDQERELPTTLQMEAGRGQVLTAKQILGRVRQAVGKKVSLDYVYRLLHRGWRKLDLRPRHVKADPQAQTEFRKLPELVAEALKDVLGEQPRRLLFQDEGNFGRINDTRRCWAPSANASRRAYAASASSPIWSVP